MAKDLLSDREVRTARPEDKEYLLSDGAGLHLRVRPSGAKDWVFIYTFGGKRRKLGLGSLDAISLAAVRQEANRVREAVATGTDPQLQRRQREEEQNALRAELEASKARLTVKSLFDKWERLELKNRKDKGAEARRSFEKDVFPFLGDVAAEDVKRGMIAACLDKVVERGSPVIARNLLGDLRQMYGFAIKRDYVENDPTSHLKRDDFGKKRERDRILNDEEIKRLYELLPAAGLRASSVAAVWIMLSTCCRIGEIGRAKWTDIDLDAGTWRIPPENSKNGKEHVVYLSDFAKPHFEALKRLAMRETGTLSAWTMPASHKDGPVCLKSLAKQIADRQRGDNTPMSNRTKETSALILPRGKWTPHDLRRTGATLMGTLGVRPDVIEKCLNHVEQNPLVRIYQRQSLEPEKKEAWRLLGERLRLITEAPRNVITMKRRKSKTAA